jgi:hypothetical protein
MDVMHSFGSPGALTFNRQDAEWDTEWERCLSLGQASFGNYLSGAFTPGSIQGIWEGIFTVRSRYHFPDVI